MRSYVCGRLIFIFITSSLLGCTSLDGHVSTVKIDGSGWSKVTEFIAQNFLKSYLYGA